MQICERSEIKGSIERNSSCDLHADDFGASCSHVGVHQNRCRSQRCGKYSVFRFGDV